jgi:hypothetical protein
MQDDHQLTALQWIWFFEHSQRSDAWDVLVFEGHLLRHQLAAPASCTKLPQPDFQVPPALSTIDISFVIATANVLTLAEGSAHSIPQLTRQRLLIDQFHNAGCHVVCLQETRRKRITDRGNDFYHIIGHPATPEGKDGVQIWISKRMPIFQGGSPFNAKQVTIVDSSTQHMIVKLQMPKWRCIIVTGRAPHSGRAEGECERFWEQIAESFVLADMNGRFSLQVIPMAMLEPLPLMPLELMEVHMKMNLEPVFTVGFLNIS